MIRSKLGELWRTWIQRRKLVGMDSAFNKYYMWQQTTPIGDIQERREVQLYNPPREISDYDPDVISAEWKSWLNGHRRVAPTAADSQSLQEYRDRVKRNAAAVDEQEAKQRLRRATLGKQVDGPDMGAFLRQLGAEEEHRETGSGVGADINTPESKGESKGEGDTFEPGQWTPGKS